MPFSPAFHPGTPWSSGLGCWRQGLSKWLRLDLNSQSYVSASWVVGITDVHYCAWVGFGAQIWHLAVSRISEEMLVAEVRVPSLVRPRVRTVPAYGEVGGMGKTALQTLNEGVFPSLSMHLLPTLCHRDREQKATRLYPDSKGEAKAHLGPVSLWVLVSCLSKQRTNRHRIRRRDGRVRTSLWV